MTTSIVDPEQRPKYVGNSITDPNQQTLEYFCSELCEFRKIMTNRQYSIEEVDAALNGLALVYLNVHTKDKTERDRLVAYFDAITHEWALRKSIELVDGIKRRQS